MSFLSRKKKKMKLKNKLHPLLQFGRKMKCEKSVIHLDNLLVR